MTFDDICRAVIRNRFNANDRADVEEWVRIRYREAWNRANWMWSLAPPIAITMTSGQYEQLLPTVVDPDDDSETLNISRVARAWDTNENVLTHIDVEDFDYLFPLRSTPQTGSPSYYAYEMVPKTSGERLERLLVGPAPSSADTLYIVPKRGYVELAVNEAPKFPEGSHYGFVIGAQALGMQMRGDPTWGPLEGRWGNWLDDLVDTHSLGPSDPFPADPL